MAAKAKPKGKGNRTMLYVLLAVAAVVGFLWWRKRQAANATMPVYSATPNSGPPSTSASSYYGSSGSGSGLYPDTSSFGTNTPLPVSSGGAAVATRQDTTPATSGVGGSSAAHGGINL